jgi:hypothetical protein
VSFYPDEVQRLDDAELFLLGATVKDLGYDCMSLQLAYDILEIQSAKAYLKHGKLPDQP